MPASMISAPTGGRPKVIGSSIAMVASGADARQHADQRADQRAEKTEQDVVGLGRDPKAQRQVREKIRHDLYTPRVRIAARAGTAG